MDVSCELLCCARAVVLAVVGATAFHQLRLLFQSRIVADFSSCGSDGGKSPVHLETARSLARAFAAQKIKLVYGGGYIGLMGEVAKTLVSLSGPDSVLGVIPEAIIKYEQADDETRKANPSFKEEIFGRTVVVPDMHTRKQRMAQEVLAGGPGSGFIALSGGYGTLEELMEITTWHQLGLHKAGVVVYNVAGFYDGLLDWIRRAVEEEFIQETNKNIIVEAKTAEEALNLLVECKVSPGQFQLDWSHNGSGEQSSRLGVDD